MAAGMTLPERNLETFRSAFAEEIAARADVESLRGVIHSDGELPRADISLATAKLLRNAGPWGQGFPEPVFDGGFEIADARIVGGKHLKLTLCEAARAGTAAGAARGAHLDAIAFGYVGGAMEDPALRPGAAVELAYRLEVNEYGGGEQVRLNCQHLKAR
jgi:single-stranded-DNA-specific exonuclease